MSRWRRGLGAAVMWRQGGVSRAARVAGIMGAMVLAADPAHAAGTVVGGVTTLLGLLAAIWAVLVASGSPLGADGAAVWLVGGAVVGTAGWAGRRLLVERFDAWRREGLDRRVGLRGWIEMQRARTGRSRLRAVEVGRGATRSRETSTARSAVSASLRGAVPSAPAGITSLIPRCPDSTWPASFDRVQVLADARRCFVALQAAWDAHDVAALAELTTPDMLADVQALLDARSHTPNHTEVLTLDAELLCIEAIGASWCASLEFSGLIRESIDAPPAPFRELWLLASPKDGATQWRLARQQALL